MEHLLLKAATTATDQGTFEAVISTASVDREGDIVEPSAFIKALEGWTKLGKHVPLAWNHTDVVIGHIDATSARVEGKEVIAKGWIDQSTERGEEAWRLVKSGTLSFSFGFLVPDGGATKRAGEKTGHHITKLDLFEISVVPIAPANNDTRVLSWKSVAAEVFPEAELEAALAGDIKAVWTAAFINDLADSAFLYVEPGGEKDGEGKTTPRSLRHFPYKDASGAVDLPHLRNALARIPQSSLSQDVKDRLTAKAQRILDNTKSVTVDETDKEAKPRSVDPLREGAMKTALDVLTSGADQPPLVTKETPKRVPDEDPDELRKRSRDLMLTVLTGIEVTE